MFTITNLRFLLILIISFSVSYAITPLMRFLSVKFKILDYPDKRKIHKNPTPLLGGIAVYIAYAVSILWNLEFSIELKAIAVGSSIILLMGVVDSWKGLPAWLRLLGQLIAASIVIFWGGASITFIPHIPGERIMEVLLTYVWLIGIPNAFNFLDGVDGLATGLGVINGLMFFMIAFLTGQVYLGFLSVALMGACAGFLRYNWKPASIFLGDGGSTFIGFVLAGLAIMGGWTMTNPLVAMGTPLFILAVPIFDMIYITASRIKNGKVRNIKEWIDYVGKDHLHHRLINLGFGERGTVIFIYFLSLCLGINGIILTRSAPGAVWLLQIQAVIILLIITSVMIVGKKHSKNSR